MAGQSADPAWGYIPLDTQSPSNSAVNCQNTRTSHPAVRQQYLADHEIHSKGGGCQYFRKQHLCLFPCDVWLNFT